MLLFYAYLGAQVAVLPFEVPILVLVAVLRREMRQRFNPLVSLMPPDLTEEEKRALAWSIRQAINGEVERFRNSKPPKEWIRPTN